MIDLKIDFWSDLERTWLHLGLQKPTKIKPSWMDFWYYFHRLLLDFSLIFDPILIDAFMFLIGFWSPTCFIFSSITRKPNNSSKYFKNEAYDNLFYICCMICALCYMLCAMCCILMLDLIFLPFAICYILYAICWLLYVRCYFLYLLHELHWNIWVQLWIGFCWTINQ